MNLSLALYLREINENIEVKEGEQLAQCFTFQDERHSRSNRLMTEFSENEINSKVGPPFADLIVAHVKCCYFILNEDYEEAFKHQTTSIQTVTKILQGMKEENWLLPVLYVLSRDLRLLSIAADKQIANESNRRSGHKPNENLEKAADLLMAVFRVCATDTRASNENSKRKAMMNIINQLFKIYFKINKLNLCKPLIRALENANLMDQFTLAQKVTYNYFLGMKCMFDSEYKKADELLTFSFNKCYPKSTKNKRLILIFLIPVKMLLGQMPKRSLLENYSVLEFEPIVEAVKDGDLRKLDAALEHYSDFYWNFGIYLVLEKLRIIAYRNLFKKVCLIMKTHQVPISSFQQILKFIQQEDISLEEVHCILANLIYEGKIKGYISLQHQKLVISKQNPFPSLSTLQG
ncbi:PCI domain-containing protein 2-like protein [Leptotrombidium deliense]|uniref:PCI domain-containing protein 2 homolog n=1 Tax=Leptotrombidium deliense TaxID=299467 RepID=A0A443SBB4_9ACAR|nr:PCI domain-containing protein 2-like protein [Leptotrombidium deliense]